jgi:hypothetical protein
MREFKLGDFVLFKNRTLARITDINNGFYKLRCLRKCKGRYSSKKRIGKPYTYQYWIDHKDLKKKSKLIATEELLFMIHFGVNE